MAKVKAVSIPLMQRLMTHNPNKVPTERAFRGWVNRSKYPYSMQRLMTPKESSKGLQYAHYRTVRTRCQ